MDQNLFKTLTDNNHDTPGETKDLDKHLIVFKTSREGLQHAIRPGRQPAEEVNRHCWQAVPESWVSHCIEPC